MKKETEKTLTPVEHTRLRSEMYLGSREVHTQTLVGYDGESFALREHTWVPALWTYFREILDNALDELVGHKYGDALTVEFDETKMEFYVHDNGRGIPCHEIPAVGKGPAASIMLSNLMSGRNFEERGDVGGANGIGASVVNFTSEWFEVEIDRDGTQDKFGTKNLTQRWEEAVKDKREISKTKGPHVIRGSKQRSGTKIMFKPSARVFPKMVLPETFVRERMWDLAVVNPKIKINYNGKRLAVPNCADPIRTFFFAERPCAVIPIKDGVFESRFYVVPNFVPEGEIDHSLVNRIPAFDGGKHMTMFKNLFYGVVAEEITKKIGKKNADAITRSMITPGVLIWNVTKMNGPNFDGQSKSRLSSDVGQNVKAGFHESDVKSFLRRNADWLDAVLSRVMKKLDDKDTKSTKREESSLLKQRIARLVDATAKHASDRILFLFEGDSAKGLFPACRDPKHHGYLPLLGKPANVFYYSPSEVVADKVLNQIISAVGLKVTEPFSKRRLRYGKIFITTDEDEDGKNITALLVNFFYKFWPEMFDPTDPILYRFKTPFLRLTKGSEIKFIYDDEYPEFIKNPGKYKSWHVYRAKGLGSLIAADWEHALKKPNLVPIVDDPEMKQVLALIFDQNRADERKEWLR